MATPENARERGRSYRLSRSQWIAFAFSLPLVALAAPLALHVPLTHAQVSALRTTICVWLLVLDIAAVAWLTRVLRRNWTLIWRRWGGRMIVLGAYSLFVPFAYLPVVYLATGTVGNMDLGVALGVVPFVASSALIGFGLLVALVELGLDPTVR